MPILKNDVVPHMSDARNFFKLQVTLGITQSSTNNLEVHNESLIAEVPRFQKNFIRVSGQLPTKVCVEIQIARRKYCS